MSMKLLRPEGAILGEFGIIFRRYLGCVSLGVDSVYLLLARVWEYLRSMCAWGCVCLMNVCTHTCLCSASVPASLLPGNMSGVCSHTSF